MSDVPFVSGGPLEHRGRQIMCKPPKPVWVHLAKVHPVEAPQGAFPDGLDLQARVPGNLHFWVLTTTGHWAGFVSYAIPQTGAGVSTSRHVLASALEPRHDAPARRRF